MGEAMKSRRQPKNRAAAQLAKDPRSSRELAALFGVSHTTVQKWADSDGSPGTWELRQRVERAGGPSARSWDERPEKPRGPARPPAAPPEPTPGSVLVPWGSPDHLTRAQRIQEAAPEGFVKNEGQLWLLCEIEARIELAKAKGSAP